MNSNVDVLKQLEVKNREIYLNKLVIDLDNNLDVLSITVNNIVSLFTNEMISKILEIENGTMNRSKISTHVEAFQEKFKDQLIVMIHERKTKMESVLKDIDQETYTEKLKEESKNIIHQIGKYYQNNIDTLYNQINTDYDEFNLKRLNDYLKENYYEKIILKLKESFNNTDIILINNYKESYQKYLELNEKTLK